MAVPFSITDLRSFIYDLGSLCKRSRRPQKRPQNPGHLHDARCLWLKTLCDGRIRHELRPRPEDVVVLKPSYGAFYDTPLETILRNLDRHTVIVTGRKQLLFDEERSRCRAG
jgi:isochorismate hydrolase